MNIRKQNLETHPGFFKCLNTKIIAICLKFNFQKVFPASTDVDIDVTAPFLPLSPQHSWKHFFCRWDMFLSFIKIIPHISFLFPQVLPYLWFHISLFFFKAVDGKSTWIISDMPPLSFFMTRKGPNFCLFRLSS